VKGINKLHVERNPQDDKVHTLLQAHRIGDVQIRSYKEYKEWSKKVRQYMWKPLE